MKTRDLVQTLLFYVGIPATTLYPLGFAGLFLQLWNDRFVPYHDPNILWDAVAYTPKIVVVGTGIELLWFSLIATLLSAGIAWLTFNILHKRRQADEEPRDRRIRRTLWTLFLLSLLPPTAVVAYDLVHVNDPYDAMCLAGFVAFSVGGGVLAGGIWSRAHGDWFRPTLVAAYIAALFAALCIATLDTPNLPLVEVNAPRAGAIPDCSELPQNRTFVKVSQSSNVLYLYNKSGFMAFYIAEVQPIRYLPSCTSLRTQRD